MIRQRILVVDDDERWLETIELLLGDEHDLALTTDPSEAESLMNAAAFALAILDQRILPDISGIDLLRRLHEIRCDMPAIILTGYAELEDAVESMKGGALDYISKGRPDLPSELRNRVQKALTEKQHGGQILALIQKGESAELEFKLSVRWDMQSGKPNEDLARAIVRTVAAFLNSENGGVLLIGVDDNGTVVGLNHEYKTLTKQGRDTFEAFLTDVLVSSYGNDISPLIHIDFHEINGEDVCRITVGPSPKAVYVHEGGGAELYIRMGTSTRRLSTQEAVEYSKTRWKPF